MCRISSSTYTISLVYVDDNYCVRIYMIVINHADGLFVRTDALSEQHNLIIKGTFGY